MTGMDYMQEFREEYTDLESSDEALTRLGQGTLFDTLLAKFGDPILGSKARKGDIGFYENSCGIVLGLYTIFLSEKGLAYVKLRHLDYAFRVPD